MQTMHPTLLIGPADWNPEAMPRAEFDRRIAALWRDHPDARQQQQDRGAEPDPSGVDPVQPVGHPQRQRHQEHQRDAQLLGAVGRPRQRSAFRTCGVAVKTTHSNPDCSRTAVRTMNNR